MSNELTLEDLDNSIVGHIIPVEIDWIENNQIVTKIIKVKVAEPDVIDKITKKYTQIDRAGNVKKITDERERLLTAEMFKHFMVAPDLSSLSLDAISTRVISKIPVGARPDIINAIRGKFDDILTLEEDALKNFVAAESPDILDSDLPQSTVDSN